MTPEETPFQFGDAWFALGLVTPERLAALRAEWASGEDRSPEHYRWQAFVEFLAERRPLSAELAAALYELGARDPDAHGMGAAMRHRIVELPECPASVLAAAAASGERHLVRAVERRARTGEPIR
ncbi:hypothetical protein J421_5364 (plasmid) [Gemmatirosa kalamazoonensis]|uniref:Uncharacterized protein n=1 Tax=Gemmatirosa kalamazoonensis TaxID=861299 RepID=W0RPG6_9BACT|nr:hypothetical protein [Gemmatirosa kalamazoonensis]AHG92899.1 hypothetical protein J421_5364 [Gemmatirosa kalamazoonensis]